MEILNAFYQKIVVDVGDFNLQKLDLLYLDEQVTSWMLSNFDEYVAIVSNVENADSGELIFDVTLKDVDITIKDGYLAISQPVVTVTDQFVKALGEFVAKYLNIEVNNVRVLKELYTYT